MHPAILVAMAREAQKYAYAPYSKFSVGAALLSYKGHIYCGANVENASYGMSMCAERAAVFKAVAAGERRFQSIAITGSGLGYTNPCGACLQVLAEFGTDIKIILTNENDEYQEHYLKEILTRTFSLAKK
jgi:cytidine deaminase